MTAQTKPMSDSQLSTRDEIIMEHLPLVKVIAVRVHETLPVHVDVDDLVHAGVLGLIDAASKYNPEKMVAFSCYAKHRIKGAILDSLRQQDWASRDLRRRHKQAEAVTRELTVTLQRSPTEEEVADRLGIEVERWRQMRVDLQNMGPVATTPNSSQEERPSLELPGKPESQPDHIAVQSQMRNALQEAMKSLPSRYQEVVTLYYSNQLTMKQIGEVLGINESRVSQIHKSALGKMNVALQSAGIRSSMAFCQ